MKIRTHCLTHQFLRQFSELRDLEFQFIETLLEKGEVLGAPKDDKLVECAFNDPTAFFLLQGQVYYQAGLLRKQLISAESKEAFQMLNNHCPKGGTFYAASDNTVLLAVKKKDIGLARAQNNKPLQQVDRSYDITEIDGVSATADDDDWMSTLLRSPLFRHIEPDNIYKLLANLRQTTYKKNDFVIREGEHDQFFYIIKSGRAEIILNNSVQQDPIEIREGSFFGEGAIVGETIHSASVKMLTDGIVCSITAENFNNILKKTILRFMDSGQLKEVSSQSLIIDVRHPVEFRHSHAADSINLPIHSLRNRIKELSKVKNYIISHGEDKRSQLAALILTEHGYNTFLLKSPES